MVFFIYFFPFSVEEAVWPSRECQTNTRENVLRIRNVVFALIMKLRYYSIRKFVISFICMRRRTTNALSAGEPLWFSFHVCWYCWIWRHATWDNMQAVQAYSAEYTINYVAIIIYFWKYFRLCIVTIFKELFEWNALFFFMFSMPFENEHRSWPIRSYNSVICRYVILNSITYCVLLLPRGEMNLLFVYINKSHYRPENHNNTLGRRCPCQYLCNFNLFRLYWS